MSDDPYAALGVAKTATQDDIRKAYKKIAKESHPDLNPGDPKAEARFKAAAAAHDLLKDAEKRAPLRRRRDRRPAARSGRSASFYREYAEGPEATYHTSRGFEDFGDFSDVFADLFGQRAGAAGGGAGEGMQMRGPDRHYTLDVGFLEAARGATRRITLPDGAGPRREDPRGPRRRPDHPAARQGRRRATAAARPATRWSRSPSSRTPSSAARATTSCVELPITLDEAVLGGKVEVPTIDGRVALTIPKGASQRPGAAAARQGRQARRQARRPAGDAEDRRAAADRRRARGLLPAAGARRHAYDPRKGVVP